MELKLIRIANFFIRKSKEDKIPLSRIKLQKLMYYAYGAHWIWHDKELFQSPFYVGKYSAALPELVPLIDAQNADPIFITQEIGCTQDIAYLNEEEEDTVGEIWRLYAKRGDFNFIDDTDYTKIFRTMDKEEIKLSFDISKRIFKMHHKVFETLAKE